MLYWMSLNEKSGKGKRNMARRTGKENLHQRVVDKDRNELARRQAEREARLEALGFELPSDEKRRENLEDHLMFFCDSIKVS